jgi:hypothetical protein
MAMAGLGIDHCAAGICRDKGAFGSTRVQPKPSYTLVRGKVVLTFERAPWPGNTAGNDSPSVFAVLRD